MSHCLDPILLRDYADYEAALNELEELFLSDPDTPAGRRFDELIALVEEFDRRSDAEHMLPYGRAAA